MVTQSELALQKMLAILKPVSSVLDIGAGVNEPAATAFRKAGHYVDTVDIHDTAIYVGDYMTLKIDKQYDAVWVAHCLEHQLNVNEFLRKTQLNIRDNGWLAITVPPAKHSIVSGHVTLWNAGILLYNLVMAGYDCSEAMCRSYGYNISVILRKRVFQLPRNLVHDAGDLKKLRQWFPNIPGQTGNNNFDGRIDELNWQQINKEGT